MNPLPCKTAVIGVGNMGKNHVRLYARISHLAAVADVSPAVGRPVAAEFHVPYYQNYLDLLNKEKPDAVSVVVPTKFHFSVVRETLKRGFPTLVEKPIAATIPEAQKMLALSRRYHTFLMVGHVERFNPAVIYLKKLIDDGKFGKIINLLSVRVGVSPPPTTNSDVALDLGIHDVDVFNFLLGKKPLGHTVVKQQLYRRNTADIASMLIRYRGVTGLIQVNWITPIKIRNLYITGTKRFAQLDYINQRIIMLQKIVPKKNLSFFELQAMSDTLTKEVYQSHKEPLREELVYFLRHLGKPINFRSVISATQALTVVSDDKSAT